MRMHAEFVRLGLRLLLYIVVGVPNECPGHPKADHYRAQIIAIRAA
jgi:hypothetical protein